MKQKHTGPHFECPDPAFLLSQFESVYFASVNRLTPEGVIYNALEELTIPPQEKFFDPRTILHLFKPVAEFSKEWFAKSCGDKRFCIYPHSLDKQKELKPFLVPAYTPPTTSFVNLSKQHLTPIMAPVIKASTQQFIPVAKCESKFSIQQQQIEPTQPLNVNISKHRFVLDANQQIKSPTMEQFKQQTNHIECFESELSEQQQTEPVRVHCLESELSEQSTSKYPIQKQIIKSSKIPKTASSFFRK